MFPLKLNSFGTFLKTLSPISDLYCWLERVQLQPSIELRIKVLIKRSLYV